MLLKLEEVTTIKGCGKQLKASVTFLIEGKYTQRLMSIGHWCYWQCDQLKGFE